MNTALEGLEQRLQESMGVAVIGLKPLDDSGREALLRDRSAARGLELPAEVSRWLLNHLPRDTGSLLAALEQLDRASLSAKRRLTLPFVQAVLTPPAPAT